MKKKKVTKLELNGKPVKALYDYKRKAPCLAINDVAEALNFLISESHVVASCGFYRGDELFVAVAELIKYLIEHKLLSPAQVSLFNCFIGKEVGPYHEEMVTRRKKPDEIIKLKDELNDSNQRYNNVSQRLNNVSEAFKSLKAAHDSLVGDLRNLIAKAITRQ